jgi:hypothetical protein
VNSKASLINPADNFAQTYFTLRLTLGVLALALPLALFLGGWLLQGISLQPSISAYYHSDARDILVGTLCAIGCGLIAYKGFGRDEDWALNLGGVLAASIALFPTDPIKALHCIQPNCTGNCLVMSAQLDRTADIAIDSMLHFPAAASFYLVLGYVMIFCSHRTLYLVPPKARRRYLVVYPALGFLFVASIVAAFVIGRFVVAATDCLDHTIFGVEVAGIFFFGVFWLIKTYESKKYDTDLRIPHRRQPFHGVPSAAAASVLRDGAAEAQRPPAPEAIQKASTWQQYKALWRG